MCFSVYLLSYVCVIEKDIYILQEFLQQEIQTNILKIMQIHTIVDDWVQIGMSAVWIICEHVAKPVLMSL